MVIEKLGKIEELEKQIANLQEEIRKLKEINRAEPWRAAKGEWYYYIDSDGSVVKDLEDYSDVHADRFRLGNYYRCKELVHQDVNELRLRNRMRQLRDAICEGYQFESSKWNWYIYYSLTEMKYCVSWNDSSKMISTIYFDTKVHAQQVCDILNAELKQKGVKNADS